MSPYVSESFFTAPPEGFGEVERNGREQSARPWALGSPSDTVGLSAAEVIGKGSRMSSEPALGIFQESLIFFCGTGGLVCQENKSDESRK